MEVDTVLVPVDGTEAAIEAVEYAVAVAERYDAIVHALYVLGESSAGAAGYGAVDDGALAERGEQVMASVRAVARSVPVDHSSAYGYSADRLAQHPGSVILDIAESLDVDFVVVPREPVADDPGAVLQQSSEYVLSHASQPVLSV
jgi:nucleotide-binding universal stress UspA family protein